jgi:hypothetical protein
VFRTHDAQLAVNRQGPAAVPDGAHGRAHLVDLLPEHHAVKTKRVKRPLTVTLRLDLAPAGGSDGETPL